MKKGNLESNYGKIAERIAQGLNVEPGEYIRISGGIHQYELLSRVAFHVSAAGGFPDITVVSDESIKKIAEDMPAEYLDRKPNQHDRYMASLYDAEITIQAILDEKLLADVPIERMKLGMERSMELKQLAKTRRRRVIIMAWPTEQKAKSCNMKHAEFEKLFLKAMYTDLDTMNKLGSSIWKVLNKGGKTRITSKKGTDLTFDIDPARRVMIDSGYFNKDMVERGDITKNLPCGEVYTTALEDTVEGTAVFDLIYVNGNPVKDLKLIFKYGKMIEATAASGIKLFHQVYDRAFGDKDRIGELGIGINPVLKKPIGHSLLDEKIFGSIHLALGENRMYGGVNDSSLHWDLVMLKSTVKVGSKTILKNGNFMI